MTLGYRYSPALIAALALLAACSAPEGGGDSEGAVIMAPRFEVDPFWPKPLPRHWLLGSTIGLDVDEEDNVWIVHRASSLEPKEIYPTWDPPASYCCFAAPPVLAFNQTGDVVQHWGGAGDGYDWPSSTHGIDVDHKGNVWLGGNGRVSTQAVPPLDENAMGEGRVHDSMVLKFTKSGTFLLQIGKPFMGTGSGDLENFRLPAKTVVDPSANELFVADGYGNRRVIVLDADTGEYKRHWGAYGNEPDDSQLPAYTPGDKPDQFRTPVHGVALANDGMLYVCDRTNDRIQVFETDGSFVQEGWVEPQTLGSGSTWDVALSRDAEQRFLYVADGANQRVHILNRQTLEHLTSFGDGGRQPGQFYGVHSIATDSKGNVYTAETYRGQRVQRFLYKGLAPVAEKQRGVPWPSD